MTRFERSVAAIRRSAWKSLSWTGLPALLATAWAVVDLPGEFMVMLAALLVSVFLLSLTGSASALMSARGMVRVIPYFSARVGDINTFMRGHAIARELEELDSLAVQHNVTPLSRFGFADDLRGEEVVWHEAAEGKQTVETLLRELATRQTDSETTIDLQALDDALARASDNGIRFCLLWREQNSTSAAEWDQRQGTAF